MRKKHFPEVLFLMETMNCRNVLVDLQVWLGYDKVFTVDPIGHAGGLAVFWKKSVNIKFQTVNKNLLDCLIQLDSVSFYASCVYGPSDWSSRCELWERLSRIGVNRKDGWCVFGDFNDILHNGEKVGGTWRADESFEPFNQMIKAGKLEELPSHGDGFTWGGRRGNLWIQSRLDRCFGNRAWSQKFPCSNQLFMAKRGSDHRPVLIKLIEPQESYRGCFRFDRRLLDLDGIKDSVTNAWHVADGSRMGTVSSRLKACRKALSALKKRSDMNSRERIRQLEFDLEQQQSSHDPSVYQIHALKRDLVKAYRDEEIYWWQKSNEKWMYAGDRNTKFFQNSVKAARAKNNIEKLLNDRGEEVFSEAAKGDVAIEFFLQTF